MNKRFLIGIVLFAVVMIVDKLIWPVPDAVALIIEAIALFLIISAAISARKAAGQNISDPGETVPYDPEKQEAVIRCSTCSDEKAAGFKDRVTGHFVEVMLIKSPEDERKFRETYGLDEVKNEY